MDRYPAQQDDPLTEGEGEVSLMLGESDAQEIGGEEKVLICYNRGRVTPYLPGGAKGACKLITIDPFAIPPDMKMKPEWIILSDAKNFSAAVRELLETAAGNFPLMDHEKVLSHIIEQEKEYSSVIGYNVALPHAYIGGIDDSLVLMSKMKNSLESKYGSDSIDYLFLVLSPLDGPGKHIKTLSEISKFILNDNNRHKLRKAETPEELVKVFFPKSLIR